ncbi:glycosyltransferase [Tenacibaculum xiamenense]|uniref:glycosyltransferase n=1 Tax=Tenacibaculum xiamenense TaxID=1261553 RepID=UPI0038B6144A
MNKNIEISASIVLYNENLDELKLTVNSFLSVPVSKRLYLIDNTQSARFKNAFDSPDIEYISNKVNVGFGKGHNQILEIIKRKSNFHLVLNPDVVFEGKIVLKLFEELRKDDDLIMIAPKILFPDNRHQFSCRRYPSFFELLVRRIIFLRKIFRSVIEKGEYSDKNLSESFYPEYLTGCFQLYKTSMFVELKGFDERYFLYMEDVDICKKIDALNYRKMYYPYEEVRHNLKQESSKKIRPLFHHIISAIKYFIKWNI